MWAQVPWAGRAWAHKHGGCCRRVRGSGVLGLFTPAHNNWVCTFLSNSASDMSCWECKTSHGKNTRNTYMMKISKHWKTRHFFFFKANTASCQTFSSIPQVKKFQWGEALLAGATRIDINPSACLGIFFKSKQSAIYPGQTQLLPRSWDFRIV